MTEKWMRAFFAIPLTNEVKIKLHAILLNLKKLEHAELIRWIPPENVHLTLRFIGQTTTTKLEKLSTSLQKTLRNYPPFEINFSQIDFFPPHRAKVIALLIESNDLLKKLNNVIEAAVREQEFPAEDRFFHPHITIGRLKTRKKIAMELFQDDINDLKMIVNQVVLYESRLDRMGATYHILEEFLLTRE